MDRRAILSVVPLFGAALVSGCMGMGMGMMPMTEANQEMLRSTCRNQASAQFGSQSMTVLGSPTMSGGMFTVEGTMGNGDEFACDFNGNGTFVQVRSI
jgi:hypothetical protein